MRTACRSHIRTGSRIPANQFCFYSRICPHVPHVRCQAAELKICLRLPCSTCVSEKSATCTIFNHSCSYLDSRSTQLLNQREGGEAALIQEARLLDSRFKDLEGAHQGLIDTHHGPTVVKLPTVVGRGEDGDQLPLREELVSIFNNLMSAANQIKVVLPQEPLNDIRSESEGNSTIVFSPTTNTLFRVGPKQIANQATVRHIGWPHDFSHLIHRLKFRGQTTMHGEDLFVNDCSYRHAVEGVSERLPNADVVPTLALVIEPIDTVNGCALVIPTKDEEVLRILDFEGQYKADGFQRLFATVNVVTQEQIVGLWRETAILKQPEEIIVLTMNITTDFDGCFKF
mmetsp:Transcript_11461/g.20687  ORF Transcript_11461/g.20687 Transcript_11461/m.20687 type:complete len:342 (+) Transcript_11461:1304-2329(+)